MTSCHNCHELPLRNRDKKTYLQPNSFVHSRCVSNLLLCKKSAETFNFCKTSLVCFQVWSSEIQSWETGLFLWVFTRQKPRHQTDPVSFLENSRDTALDSSRSIEASGWSPLLFSTPQLLTSWAPEHAISCLSKAGGIELPLQSLTYFEFLKIRKLPASVYGFSYLGSAPPII